MPGCIIFILVKCPFFALEYFSFRIGHVFERACTTVGSCSVGYTPPPFTLTLFYSVYVTKGFTFFAMIFFS
jgi:hypothetical protein